MQDNLIVVCVPTCKRSDLLGECLAAIGKLLRPDNCQIKVAVVDNDYEKSAEATCLSLASSLQYPLYYFVHQERGLSSVRNRLLAEAVKMKADFIAFIDDDEQPDASWLLQHMTNIHRHKADVSCGPVRPINTSQPVSDRKAKATGSRPRHVSTNNVVLKSSLVTTQALRFDPFYNFIGGEDFDFFDRSGKLGNVHIWVEEALVLETIPLERDNLRYLFYRHFTGGINNVMRFKRHNPGWQAWARFLPKIVGKILSATACLVFSGIKANRALFSDAVKKFASAIGYQAGLLNIVVERYREIEPERKTGAQ